MTKSEVDMPDTYENWEDLLEVFVNQEPDPEIRSTYAINGRPAVWELARDGEFTLFGHPKRTQDRTPAGWEEVDGVFYQWHHAIRGWIDQGKVGTLEYLNKAIAKGAPR